MKAVTFNPISDQFVVKEIDIPVPAKGEVLVKVLACGLNPVDAKIIHWKNSAAQMNNSWIPGLDVAGEILAVGEAVSHWKVGDKVLYHGNMFQPNGGFAEFAIHNANTLLPHPKVSSVVAAATPCAGWTAWRAIVDKLSVQKHDSLFIMGASGGVGSFAIQIAKLLNVEKIIACCSTQNHEYVMSLGATHVVDYKEEDWFDRVLAMTDGLGVDKIIDAVGREHDIALSNLLAYEGEMIALVSSLRTEAYDNIFMRGLSFHQLSLGAGHNNGKKGMSNLVHAGMAFSSHLETGAISVPVIHEVSLDEVGPTLEKMRNRNNLGKYVMVL